MNWYAVAKVSHDVHCSLTASATFCGVNVSGLPTTNTTWMAMATVWQSVQLAYATAAFWGATVPSVIWRIEKASLKTELPSWVLTTTASFVGDGLSATAVLGATTTSSATTRPAAARRNRVNGGSEGIGPVMPRCRSGQPPNVAAWTGVRGRGARGSNHSRPVRTGSGRGGG